MKKWFVYLVLTVVLVGFPLVSYIYLKGGYNYRKAAIDMMEDHGRMPDLTRLDRVRGNLPDSLRGNMVVIGWLTAEHETAANIYGRKLDSLYTQFANSPHLYFTTIAAPSMTDSLIDDWLLRFELPQDDPMLSVLRAPQDFFSNSKSSFGLAKSANAETSSDAVVALVDSSSTIIKHYDLVNHDETVSLVQLISLFIPLPAEEDIILDRDKEL